MSRLLNNLLPASDLLKSFEPALSTVEGLLKTLAAAERAASRLALTEEKNNCK